MYTKLLQSVLVLFIGFAFTGAVAWAQNGTIEGQVINQETGEALISANIYIAELQRGDATNAEGEFSIDNIPYGTYQLRVSYIGYSTKNVTVTVDEATETVDISLQPAAGTLDELVVTGLGTRAEQRSVSAASQSVDADALTIAKSGGVKSSLAGKVAGVQFLGQAGSKLGVHEDIRIRGALSLTSALSEPLYIVDGVPVQELDLINKNNISNITVLKGANAAALYGQRGENGVVVVQTKQASRAGVSVEVNSSLTFQDAVNLPEFQNEYGQGYAGDEMQVFNYDPTIHPDYWEIMDGKRYTETFAADASWGPRLDGEPYAAWYTWWPDSPYYGQSVPYEAHPGNVANFYDRGVIAQNGIALNVFDERYSARVSYTNMQQGGILPYTNLDKNFVSGNVQYDVSDALNLRTSIKYTTQSIHGRVRSDGYGNQTSGSFNNWFGRNLDASKMRGLAGLRTPEGYFATWNWWGPETYAEALNEGDEDYLKPVFWFNPSTWLKQNNQIRDEKNLLLNLVAIYQLSENFELEADASTYTQNNSFETYLPFTIEESSAHSLYTSNVNSFGVSEQEYRENNYSARLNYRSAYGDWTFDAFGGGEIRVQHAKDFESFMSSSNFQSGGLIIPDVFSFSNSRETIIPERTDSDKKVYSLYGKASIGYKDFLFLNGTYRQDWSSALPADNNGYGYPSIGATFVFTELVDAGPITYGMIRANWAQTGDDVGAEAIFQTFNLTNVSYANPVTGATITPMYTADVRIDPNIKPAINTSFEVGTDLRFIENRIGLSVTYYNATREDEIIRLGLSSTTGNSAILTNAGSSERSGVEIALDGDLVRSESFQWNLLLNIARNRTYVNSLPGGNDTYDIPISQAFSFIFLTQRVDEEWGQIRGTGIQRTEDGTPVVTENGLFVAQANKYYGSVLPDFTGGVVNNLSYKNFNLGVVIDFQSGGQFFSLTEQWGSNTGLLKQTAGSNDRGNPKRDDVSEGGGIHVTGVTESGQSVDTYVDANTYYTQFFSNRIAEPFIHDASYIKLRAINLSYTLLPGDLFGGAIRSATIGIEARNVLMLYTNNPYKWDPSQFGNQFFENGQLPGTRSYGINLNITF